MNLVTIHDAVACQQPDGSTCHTARVTQTHGNREIQVGELHYTQGDWQLVVFDLLDDSRYTLPVVHQVESDAHAFTQGYFLGCDHGKAHIASQF